MIYKKNNKRKILISAMILGFGVSLFGIQNAFSAEPGWQVSCYRTAAYVKQGLGKTGTFPVSACSYNAAIAKSNQLGVKFKDRYGCFNAKLYWPGMCNGKMVRP